MACEHIQVPLGDGTFTTAIVCGVKRKKAAPCQFCGQPSSKLCDWKCDKPTKINHSELKPDDIVVTVQRKFRLPVQGLKRLRGSFTKRNGRRCFVVTMYGLNFPEDRGSWLYYLGGTDTVNVLRPGTCDAPCCELHSRSVDEDVDYCMEHWGSWSEVK